MSDFTVSVSVHVSDEDIEDIALMASHWEWWGGIHMNAEEVRFEKVDPDTGDRRLYPMPIDRFRYIVASWMSMRGLLEVTPNPQEGLLGLPSASVGIDVVALDANSADVICQIAVYGETVYG